MTEKQLEALREMKGHGNTMRSLHRHGLIYRNGPAGWARGVRGELVLAGWTLEGLDSWISGRSFERPHGDPS